MSLEFLIISFKKPNHELLLLICRKVVKGLGLSWEAFLVKLASLLLTEDECDFITLDSDLRPISLYIINIT